MAQRPLFISPTFCKFARLQLHYQPGVCALRCEKPKAPHEIPSGMATKAKIPAAHFLRADTLSSDCLRLSGSGTAAGRQDSRSRRSRALFVLPRRAKDGVDVTLCRPT